MTRHCSLAESPFVLRRRLNNLVVSTTCAAKTTTNGIQSLSLSFYGDPDNTGQLYFKINDAKIPYEGDAADIASAAWQVWNIDLSTVGANLGNVTLLTIGIEGAGAAGVVYIDDVRLVSPAL